MNIKDKIKKNSGFTIAELLIVIAIMILLVGISVPTFSSALNKARVASDMTNLQNIATEYTTEAVLNEIYDTNGKVTAPSCKLAATSEKICITVTDSGASVAEAADENAEFTTSIVNVSIIKNYKGALTDTMKLKSGEFAWDSSTGTFVYSEEDGGTIAAE